MADQSRALASKLYRQLCRHPRVLAVDGHIEGYEDWFVELKPGWKWAGDPALPTHGIGVSTLTEAMAEVRRALPCDCVQCVNREE